MARVRLYFPDQDLQNLLDANGGVISLTYLRLSAMLRVGPDKLIRDGLMDTGTALTVIPENLWRRFEGGIDWLHPPPGQRLPRWWTHATGLTGGAYACRIGRIPLTIFDAEKHELRDMPVTAKFVKDHGKLGERVLLGLAHGILHDRQPTIDPNAREAWLEDRAAASRG